MQKQVQQLAPSDIYWEQVGLNLAMLRGITAGCNQVLLRCLYVRSHSLQ
jgi:hypothetical protein